MPGPYTGIPCGQCVPDAEGAPETGDTGSGGVRPWKAQAARGALRQPGIH